MLSKKTNLYRSHACSDLQKKNVGDLVTLSGWIDRKRDHGGLLFIDLRDESGICQLVLEPSQKNLFEKLEALRVESVITISGQVVERSQETVNVSLSTGEIEVQVKSAMIESEADASPFSVTEDSNVSEELRLQYRFFDLRRKRLKKNIVFRSKLAMEIRKFLYSYGFHEIHTPILTSSSPEGARDFLVPSRKHPGKFYALPQAPQQFKQLLMAGGFEKYFQIAPCFRDEDARADRSPGEFYQLDIEMSFVTQEDIFRIIEDLFSQITNKVSKKKIKSLPFHRFSYKEAINKFGTDKPDIRIPLELVEVKDLFKESKFRVFAQNAKEGKTVKAFVLKGKSNESRLFYDKAEQRAKELGLPGLAYIQFKPGETKGPILKFLTDIELSALKKRLNIEEGDVVFFGAGDWLKTCKTLGEIRNYFGSLFNLDQKELAFCWIVDFPMYEYNTITKKIDFSHNPFSMPQGGMKSLTSQSPLDILAYQYDIVCNGIELSSGAIRNHRPDIMYKAFEIANYSKADVDNKFSQMILAFKLGTPPHGGIAPGFDRIVMIYQDEENLREVIPFPMNQKAEDLMMHAPSSVSQEHLKELGISIKPNLSAKTK